MKIFYYIILIIFSYDVLSKEITILNDIKGRGFEIINHTNVKVNYIGKLVDGKEYQYYLFCYKNFLHLNFHLM